MSGVSVMSVLRYEFVDPTVNSSKFWEVEHPHKGDAKIFWTRWGKIGSQGQTEVSPYPSAEEAKKKLAQKIREKERKGYVLVKGDAARARSAAQGPGRTAKGPKAGNKFSVQLLATWDKKWLPKHAVTEPKIDGIRAVFVFAGDRFCCFSRNGNTLHNVSHIAAELGRSFDGWCLDGEIIAGGTWEGTMEAVRSDERDGGSDAYFAVFDCLSHEELDTRTCHRPLSERREVLRRLWPGRTEFCGILREDPVRSVQDVERHLEAYLKQGFEGAVIKDLDSFYKFRRSSDWQKVKVFDTKDYKIVGLDRGGQG
jgi:ATP-dependent DNA ligase